MSRLTDELDATGAGPIPEASRRPLRAVVSTRADVAEAAFESLLRGESGASISSRWPVRLGVAATEPAEPPTRTHGYRGHELRAVDLPATRVAMHALRLLEEDPLGHLSPAERDALITDALGWAAKAEREGSPFEVRVSDERIDATLALPPVAPPPSSPTLTQNPPEALLVLDGEGGASICSEEELAAVAMFRADRPALLVAADAGRGLEPSVPAAAIVGLIVAFVDGGQTLSEIGAFCPDGASLVATQLDERGHFDTLSLPTRSLEVRGFERMPAPTEKS